MTVDSERKACVLCKLQDLGGSRLVSGIILKVIGWVRAVVNLCVIGKSLGLGSGSGVDLRQRYRVSHVRVLGWKLVRIK